MKTLSAFAVSCFILIGISSCNKPNPAANLSAMMKKATGWPYEVLVVMDKNVWKGEAGQIIREELTMPVPALPQSEPSLRVSYSEPSGFNSFLRYVRNILLVDINPDLYTKVSVHKMRDKWSSGQYIVRLTAPSSSALSEYVLLHDRSLVNYFEQAEQNRRIAMLSRTHSSWIAKRLQDNLGVSLFVPEEMSAYKDTSDFFWVSNNAVKGRSDIVVYSFPYSGSAKPTAELLISKRDSVLRKNVPGAFPGSYMTTEKRFPPAYEQLADGGKNCCVLRGLWDMEGDKMGGPFVSYAYHDKANSRILVAEGFVFAPESKKANLMRQLEASLLTVSFQK